MTHPGTSKTARLARDIAANGPFRWWWQVMGSNHRRLSQRFYKTLARSAKYMPLTSRCAAGEVSRRRRRTLRDSGGTRAGHGQGYARPPTADKEWSYHRPPLPRPSVKEPARRRPRQTASRDRNPARTIPIGSRYQHRFSTRSGNDGKQPARFRVNRTRKRTALLPS
jgi:hypothetical protein